MSLKRSLSLGVLASLAMLSIPAAAVADSGGLDTTYPTGGRTQVPTAVGTSSFADSIELADGSIVGVGSTGAVGARNAFIAKVLPGGGLDASFGSGGVTTFDAGGDDIVLDVSRRTAGGFILSGQTDPDIANATGFFAKLTPAGALDLTWNGTGITDVFTGTTTRQVAYTLETASGDVIITGNIDNTIGTYASRVDQTGTPNTWSNLLNVPSVVNNEVNGLVRRADGQLAILTTSFDTATSPTDFVVHTIDETTGITVESPTLTRPVPTRVNDLELLPGDGLQLIGETTPSGSTVSRGGIWRLTAAGAIDASFGTGGEVLLPAATEAWGAVDLDSTSTGGYYVTGYIGTDRTRTIKLTPSFGIDPSFAQGGIADRTYGASPSTPEAIYVDSSDRPVVVGSLGSIASAWRIERFDYASTVLGAVTYSPSFVQRLNTLNFSYSVRNDGPDATDVTVDIDLPASVEEQAFSPSFGVVTPAGDRTGGTWVVTKLATGSTATLTVSGKPGDVGTLTSTATIISQSSVRVGAAPAPASNSVMVYGAATPRDDVITLTPRNDVVDALAGNDIVYALAGNDVVDGNTGDDQLFGALGDDRMTGGEGNDLLDGGGDDDELDGGNGNDRVLGGSGNDVVAGGEGDNVLDGADGNDRITAGAGNDAVTAGDGNNAVSVGNGTNTVTAGTGNDTVATGSGNDVIAVGAGNNVVAAGDGTNKVTSGSGNDRLTSGTGNDAISAGAGNDVADGGAGNDVVDAGDGNDTALGGAGNDRVYGRAGNDKLDSGEGNDLVFAGPGKDRVQGGNGADRLYGETGDDYLIAQGSGDKLYGGPGRDRLDGGAAADAIWGGTGNDWINGKTGNDYLVGNEGADWIRGYLGNDRLYGGNGRDLLNGGAGADVLSAGSGNDIIRADDGFGTDVVDCGTGWDLVYANAGDRIASNCEYVKYDVPAGTPYTRGGSSNGTTPFARIVAAL